MQRRILISFGVALAASSLAVAAGSPADYDGDGRISKEEFRNQSAKAAFEIDKNKNGAIDDDELKLSAEQRKKLDTNSDGKVSVEELQEGQMSGFGEIDKNGNGFLEQNEMPGR